MTGHIVCALIVFFIEWLIYFKGYRDGYNECLHDEGH